MCGDEDTSARPFVSCCSLVRLHEAMAAAWLGDVVDGRYCETGRGTGVVAEEIEC